jgi:DNA-binding MarR family transcriptional regulator
MDDFFRNFLRFRQALSIAHRQSCRRLNLDPRLAALLRALDDLGPSSAVDLSRATLSDPATVNRVVAGAVGMGLIRQVQNPKDRRCCRLTLTPGPGRSLARQVAREYALLARKTFQAFSAVERRRFNRDLGRLTAHLTDLNRIHDGVPGKSRPPARRPAAQARPRRTAKNFALAELVIAETHGA